MAVMDKPDLDEDLLIHFGIKGMKWGVRRGKGTTGITRHRGARIDTNDRAISRIKGAMRGDKSVSPARQRAMLKVGQTVLGKDRMTRILNQKVSGLKAHNARLKSGKLRAGDRLDLMLNVGVGELLVSNRPK